MPPLTSIMYVLLISMLYTYLDKITFFSFSSKLRCIIFFPKLARPNGALSLHANHINFYPFIPFPHVFYWQFFPYVIFLMTQLRLTYKHCINSLPSLSRRFLVLQICVHLVVSLHNERRARNRLKLHSLFVQFVRQSNDFQGTILNTAYQTTHEDGGPPAASITISQQAKTFIIQRKA